MSRVRAWTMTLAILGALVACGDDDDDSSTIDTDVPVTDAPAPTDSSAPETTEPATTLPIGEDGECDQSAPDTTLDDDPTPDSEPIRLVCGDDQTLIVREDGGCAYRPDEIISAGAEDVAAALDGLGATVGEPVDLSIDGAERNVALYPLSGIDPFDAAALLAAEGIEAAPNYLFGFAPGWKYSPADAPTPSQRTPPVSALAGSVDEATTIAVVDTGYSEIPNRPPTNVAIVSTPVDVLPLPLPVNGAAIVQRASDEVLDGAAAGHGTFIATLLASLLPAGTVQMIGLPPRTPADDGFVIPDVMAGDDAAANDENKAVVNIRDDATVAGAIRSAYSAMGASIINISGGTHGCTGVEVSTGDRLGTGAFRTTLGIRQVLLGLRTSTPELIVVAAAGNDHHNPTDEPQARFFPAAFAVNACFQPAATDLTPCAEALPDGSEAFPDGYSEWMLSVASDVDDGNDYSNWGPWVSVQAKGSNTVSWLPPGTTWNMGQAGLYSWSGTSFAAPCVAALIALDLQNAPAALIASARVMADYPALPDVRAGDYADCFANEP